MAWIESHETLRTHVKTRRLRRFLGISTAQAIGHLHMLWWWGIQHSTYGLIPPDYEPEDIAEACGWDGKAETIVAALLTAGWLVRLENGWMDIHGWLERCGAILRRRYKNEMKKLEATAEIAEYRDMLVAESGPEQLTLPGDSGLQAIVSRRQALVTQHGKEGGLPTDHTDITDRTGSVRERAARAALPAPDKGESKDSKPDTEELVRRAQADYRNAQ